MFKIFFTELSYQVEIMLLKVLAFFFGAILQFNGLVEPNEYVTEVDDKEIDFRF